MKALFAKGTKSSRTSKTANERLVDNTGVGMSNLEIDLHTDGDEINEVPDIWATEEKKRPN